MSVHDCVPSFDPLPMHFRLRCVSALAFGAVYVSICGLQDAQDCLGMLYCSLAEIPSCINRLLTSNSIKRDIIGHRWKFPGKLIEYWTIRSSDMEDSGKIQDSGSSGKVIHVQPWKAESLQGLAISSCWAKSNRESLYIKSIKKRNIKVVI